MQVLQTFTSLLLRYTILHRAVQTRAVTMESLKCELRPSVASRLLRRTLQANNASRRHHSTSIAARTQQWASLDQRSTRKPIEPICMLQRRRLATSSEKPAASLPLEGITVVSLEQAIAAPVGITWYYQRELHDADCCRTSSLLAT